MSQRSGLPGTRIPPSNLTGFATGLFAFWPARALTPSVKAIAPVNTKSPTTFGFMGTPVADLLADLAYIMSRSQHQINTCRIYRIYKDVPYKCSLSHRPKTT